MITVTDSEVQNINAALIALSEKINKMQTGTTVDVEKVVRDVLAEYKVNNAETQVDISSVKKDIVSLSNYAMENRELLSDLRRLINLSYDEETKTLYWTLNDKEVWWQIGGDEGGNELLTQAEYNALSPEEKEANIIRVISDSSPEEVVKSNVNDNIVDVSSTWSSQKIVDTLDLPSDSALHIDFNQIPDAPNGNNIFYNNRQMESVTWQTDVGSTTISTIDGVANIKSTDNNTFNAYISLGSSFSNALVSTEISLNRKCTVNLKTKYNGTWNVYYTTVCEKGTSKLNLMAPSQTLDSNSFVIEIVPIDIFDGFTYTWLQIYSLYIGNGSFENGFYLDDISSKDIKWQVSNVVSEYPNSVRFMNANSYVMATNTLFNQDTPVKYTVSAWIKNWDKTSPIFLLNNWDAYRVAPIYMTGAIAGSDTDYEGQFQMAVYHTQNDSYITRWRFFDSVPDGDFLLTVVVDDEETEVYINDKKMAVKTLWDRFAFPAASRNKNLFQIGRSMSQPSYAYTNATFEDWQLWLRPLSIKEIKALYYSKDSIKGAPGSKGDKGDQGYSVVMNTYNLRTYNTSQFNQYSTPGYTGYWADTNAANIRPNDIFIVPVKISDQDNIIGQIYNKVTSVEQINTTTWYVYTTALFGVTGQRGQKGDTGPSGATSDFRFDKVDGTLTARYFHIATLLSISNADNIDGVEISGVSNYTRSFRYTIKTRGNYQIDSWEDDALDIRLYTQSNGDVKVYIRDANTYNRVAGLVSCTSGAFKYTGTRPAETPTGTEITTGITKIQHWYDKNANQDSENHSGSATIWYYKIKPSEATRNMMDIVSDSYGGTVLVTGIPGNDVQLGGNYHAVKANRLSSGDWNSDSSYTTNIVGKITNVYLGSDGSVYIKIGSYCNIAANNLSPYGVTFSYETALPSSYREIPIVSNIGETDDDAGMVDISSSCTKSLGVSQVLAYKKGRTVYMYISGVYSGARTISTQVLVSDLPAKYIPTISAEQTFALMAYDSTHYSMASRGSISPAGRIQLGESGWYKNAEIRAGFTYIL